MSKNRFLIIGGAEKAGTTSLYTYLAAHPGVVRSLRKETDFFRSEGGTLQAYLSEFPSGGSESVVAMESSPGYLAEANAVAPRIAAVTPEARLVFILRDPIDRLRSSFRFYKSRLHVPQTMSFEDFVQHCFSFEARQRTPEQIGIKAWHLGSLTRGSYETQLAAFEQVMPPAQLLVLHYDSLRDDVHACVGRIARFAGLDAAFYDGFQFGRENVSFLARNSAMQRLAIQLNDRLEGIWRRQPALKQRLLRLYKRLNQRELDSDPLSESTLFRLREWYAPTQVLLDRVRRAPSD